MTHISQREARLLRQRVQALTAERQRQRKEWAEDYPGGVHLCSIPVSTEAYAIVRTARQLGHAVVLTCPDEGQVRLYGLPLPQA